MKEGRRKKWLEKQEATVQLKPSKKRLDYHPEVSETNPVEILEATKE